MPEPDVVKDTVSHSHDVLDEEKVNESFLDEMECESGSQSICDESEENISAQEETGDDAHKEDACDSSDSDSAMDEVQASENHSPKCHLDYRLLTFQEMGRYMNNNPGSYYDHSKKLWFCSICQNFGRVNKYNAWSDKGI